MAQDIVKAIWMGLHFLRLWISPSFYLNVYLVASKGLLLWLHGLVLIFLWNLKELLALSNRLVVLSLRCLATIKPLRSQLFLDTYLLLDPLESITDRHIMVRSLQELWVITTRCGLQFLGIWFRNSLIVVSVWHAVVNFAKRICTVLLIGCC